MIRYLLGFGGYVPQNEPDDIPLGQRDLGRNAQALVTLWPQIQFFKFQVAQLFSLRNRMSSRRVLWRLVGCRNVQAVSKVESQIRRAEYDLLAWFLSKLARVVVNNLSQRCESKMSVNPHGGANLHQMIVAGVIESGSAFHTNRNVSTNDLCVSRMSYRTFREISPKRLASTRRTSQFVNGWLTVLMPGVVFCLGKKSCSAVGQHLRYHFGSSDDNCL